jgi:hypothetical protein
VITAQLAVVSLVDLIHAGASGSLLFRPRAIASACDIDLI